MSTPDLTLAQWLELLSPSGQEKIIHFIQRAKEERGKHWLPAIKAEFPFASWIVELVATKTADEALDEICLTYPSLPVRVLAGERIRALHARLLYEIEKPR